MDLSELEYLLLDDSEEFKYLLDNFMHFPMSKFMYDNKEDEETLLNCMKYALSDSGVTLLENDESKLVENRAKGSDRFMNQRVKILPYTKKPVSDVKVISLNTSSNVSFKYVQTLYKDTSDEAFFTELKVTKRTFWRILNEISCTEFFSRDCITGPGATKAEVALDIFFTYLSKKSTFKTLSSKFHLSESAIMGNFARCVSAINSLEAKYVTWGNDNRMAEDESQFQEMSGLQGVIGAMGTCCIEMRTIKEPPAGYKIGKQKSIMYLLAVADARAKFTYIQAGYPATFAPQEAFESSSLGKGMTDSESPFFPSDQYHLITASSNFILQENLLTPYEFPDNLDQEGYNLRLEKCDTIEKAFTHLRSRFGVLQEQIFSSLEKIPNIIKACCIVHNICVEDEDDRQFLEPFIVQNIRDYSLFVYDSDFYPLEPTDKAILKRDTIVATLEAL